MGNNGEYGGMFLTFDGSRDHRFVLLGTFIVAVERFEEGLPQCSTHAACKRHPGQFIHPSLAQHEQPPVARYMQPALSNSRD